MHDDTRTAQLIGFENDKGVGDLLAQFGMFQGYPQTVPAHLLGIFRQQHPDTVIESVEFIDAPKCSLGGTERGANRDVVTVQTLDVPLDLRVMVRVARSRLELDVRLVIRGEGLDGVPTVRSDMHVTGQRVIS